MLQKTGLFVCVVVSLCFGVLSAGATAQDLCTGVGACNRVWTTSGDALWFLQTAVNHDGINALSNGDSSGGVSNLETTITGPATISFWWTVRNPVADQGISFLVDDVGVFFNTSSDWTQSTYTITAPGSHTLTWSFYPYVGGPTGYLDQFLVEESVAPTGTMVINSGASLTATGDVTLSLTYDDGDGSGVTKMRFSNNGATWSAWENPAATKAWALDPGDGYRTVRAQFRDKAGNFSSVLKDYILVDKTPPTGSVLINAGAPTTPTAVVSLGLAWEDGTGSGVKRMRFSIDGETWSVWEPVETPHAYTLPAPPGLYTVRAQYRDRAGNVSIRYNDYIRLVAP